MILRTAGVVHAHRRLAARERDLAHRHADALRTVDGTLLELGKAVENSDISALPPPVLAGSGSKGLISIPDIGDTPGGNFEYYVKPLDSAIPRLPSHPDR